MTPGYEARHRMLTIRHRDAERASWERAAGVKGFEGVSSWARAVLNLAARQTISEALEDVPDSELDGREG